MLLSLSLPLHPTQAFNMLFFLQPCPCSIVKATLSFDQQNPTGFEQPAICAFVSSTETLNPKPLNIIAGHLRANVAASLWGDTFRGQGCGRFFHTSKFELMMVLPSLYTIVLLRMLLMLHDGGCNASSWYCTGISTSTGIGTSGGIAKYYHRAMAP